MKRAGVVLDKWKLPVFQKILDDAGYDYTQHPGITKDTLTLMVEYDFVAKLQPFIEKAQEECRKLKKRRRK